MEIEQKIYLKQNIVITSQKDFNNWGKAVNPVNNVSNSLTETAIDFNRQNC